MKPGYFKSLLASAVFLLSAGIHITWSQPPRPDTPVIVNNTSANPVPVTGQVNIGTLPAVDAKQSGIWNVGISGTPTVKLDTTGNTVKVERRESVQRLQTTTWTGQPDDAMTTNSTDRFSKMKVCIAHAAPNAIQVNVFSLITDAFDGLSAFITYDAFIISTPSTVCRTYDLPGVSVQVKLSNTGNNASGLTRFAVVFGD
ncbi:MAG: hypothetical protein WBD22_04225 [Pyrinomonadaceae bacterium]